MSDAGHEQVEYAWDDITGAQMDPGEARKARMTEIGYAKRKNVWEKSPGHQRSAEVGKLSTSDGSTSIRVIWRTRCTEVGWWARSSITEEVKDSLRAHRHWKH